MSRPSTASRFQTTRRTLVRAAGSDEDARNQLLTIYWGPIYAYLRRSGHSEHDASDLTHGFLLEKMIEGKLISRFDPSRGRFRSFLLTALDRYVIDVDRRQHGRRRAHTVLPMDPAQLKTIEPPPDSDPMSAFDWQYYSTLFSVILERLEKQMRENGQERHWQAFEARVIRPNIDGVTAPRLENIATELGLEEVEKVSSLIRSARRWFHEMTMTVLAETLPPAEAAAEFESLKRSLLKRPRS